MGPSTLFERVTTHLDRATGEVEYRLLHAVRSLVWLIATIACALLAGAFGASALIVSLWDTQHLLPLIVPAVTFAVLAGCFGFIAARTVRAHRLGTTIDAERPPAAPGAPAGGPAAPQTMLRRGHPLAWIVAAVGLLYLGPSREFVALAVRLRGVMALLGHAAHVVQLFSKARSRGVRAD